LPILFIQQIQINQNLKERMKKVIFGKLFIKNILKKMIAKEFGELAFLVLMNYENYINVS